ncbi:MAG TPA: glycosyltransferase family 9 protein [Chloroflexota bacterium]|nr:glycosyltransferase family 9 protein [Chloroflexota bacterium]
MTGAAFRQDARLRLLRGAGALRRPPPLPDAPSRILIIRPDHLGDLILAAGSVAALRQAFPEARLTAWLGPWGEPVWRHHSALDGIEVCAFPGFTRAPKPNPLAPYIQAVRAAGCLRGGFDVALNLRPDFWWGAMAACWAGIPVVGYAVAECRPFLARAVAYTPGGHAVDESLGLVRELAGRPIHPGAPCELFAPASLPEGLPRGAIAIHPGAGAEVKLWDAGKWAAVARELVNDAPVAITAGNEGEQRMAEFIREQAGGRVQVVAGLELNELAAFYKSCRLVLGPDNGPLHVARFVGTPTVTLFGPTDPAIFGPRSDGSDEVLRLPWRCIPCGRLDYNPAELSYHLCVKLIEPEEVLASARRVLVAQVSRPS